MGETRGRVREERREEEEGRGEEEKVGERKEGQEGREDLRFLVKWCSRIG
jgi:hypothetical protein